jgi:glycosyltransferase involved in cell wall biosynthesis
MTIDILVAHPLKHHVLNLTSGCQDSGLTVRLITPLYKKGWLKYLAKVSGLLGKKINGYYYEKLNPDNVISPFIWQIKRIFVPNKKTISFQESFDRYVASLIRANKLKPKVLITLQDYMPKTVMAARKKGILIWTDQILNRSSETRGKLEKNLKDAGCEYIDQYSEKYNNEILAVADVVTVACKYTAQGLSQRINLDCNIEIIPYGVDQEKFVHTGTKSTASVVILARANNVRKGGHLLLKSIEENAELLLKLANNARIEVNIIGTLDNIVAEKLNKLILPLGFVINAKVIPSIEMASEFAKADLFIMPSFSEGMSLMCIEAMQMGLPLIITEECGIDCFRNNEMGVEVDCSLESINEGLIFAFQNKKRWLAWGEACKREAEELNWVIYEQKIAKLAASTLISEEGKL